MVLRLLEGFETKQVIVTKWDRIYTPSGVAGTPVPGRKAGSAITSNTMVLVSEELVSPDENIWIIGFAIRKINNTAFGGSGDVGIQLQNASGEQCSLVLINAGIGGYQVQLKRGTTVIDTTPEAFLGGNQKSWMYFQAKLTCRTGTNGAYELRSYDYLNASTVQFSGTLVNLAEQAVDGADRIRISWDANGGASVDLDDVIAMDSTGTKNNDFLAKPVVIVGSLPDADGNQTDWAPSIGVDNFALVDDPANSAVDTDRVSAQVIGDIDLYSYANLPQIHSAGVTVVGAQVISTAAMLASGQRTLRVRVREATDEAFGSNFIVNDLTIRSTRQLFDQNPTGVPADWTIADLNAAEFGIEIQA